MAERPKRLDKVKAMGKYYGIVSHVNEDNENDNKVLVWIPSRKDSIWFEVADLEVINK